LTVTAGWPEGRLVVGQFGDTEIVPRDAQQTKLFDFMANLLRSEEGLPPTKHFEGQVDDQADGERESPDDPEWVPVWIPQLKKLKVDADKPSAEKIGGLPGLPRGSKWPYLSGKPAVFIMQFRDPRPGHKQRFLQLFVPQVEDIRGSGEKVVLRQVDPDALVAPARTYPGTTYGEHVFEIAGWTSGRETSEHHVARARCESENEADEQECVEQMEEVREQLPRHYAREKVGGLGETCQGDDYALFIHNLFPAQWGDAGYLHVTEDGRLVGDMC
jgi:hypothetical protein